MVQAASFAPNAGEPHVLGGDPMQRPGLGSDEELTPGPYFEAYFFWSRFGNFTGLHQYLAFLMYVPVGCCLMACRAICMMFLVLIDVILHVQAGQRHQHSNRGCSTHCFVVQLGRNPSSVMSRYLGRQSYPIFFCSRCGRRSMEQTKRTPPRLHTSVHESS